MLPPRSEFYFTYTRSSGPGGQNVNKVNSKAVLHWNVALSPSLPEDVRARLLARYPNRITKEGELQITSDRFRDRGKNEADCLEKLREILASVKTPPKPRKKTKPTRASRRKRLESKRLHGEKKKARRAVF